MENGFKNIHNLWLSKVMLFRKFSSINKNNEEMQYDQDKKFNLFNDNIVNSDNKEYIEYKHEPSNKLSKNNKFKSEYYIEYLSKEKKALSIVKERGIIFDKKRNKYSELDLLTTLHGEYKKKILLNDNNKAFKNVLLRKNKNDFNYISEEKDILFNNRNRVDTIKKLQLKSIISEKYNDIITRKMENRLTKPHYFFTPLYVARSMTTQLRSWPNTIYSFMKPILRNIKYLDSVTTDLIKLFFNPISMRRKVVEGKKTTDKAIGGISIVPIRVFIKYMNNVIKYTSLRSGETLKDVRFFSRGILTLPWIKNEINWAKAFRKYLESRKTGIVLGYAPKRSVLFNKARKIFLSKPLFKHTAFNVIIDLFVYNNKSYKLGKYHNMLKARALYKYMYSMYIDYSSIIQNILTRPRIFYLNIIEPKVYYYYSNVLVNYERILIHFSKRQFIYILLFILKWNLNNKFFSVLNFTLNKNKELAQSLSCFQTDFHTWTDIKSSSVDSKDKELLLVNDRHNIHNYDDDNNNNKTSSFGKWIFKKYRAINNNTISYLIKSLRLKNNIYKYRSLYNRDKENKYINDFINKINNIIIKKNNKGLLSWWNTQFYLSNDKIQGPRVNKVEMNKQYYKEKERLADTPVNLDDYTLFSREGLGPIVKEVSLGKNKLRRYKRFNKLTGIRNKSFKYQNLNHLKRTQFKDIKNTDNNKSSNNFNKNKNYDNNIKYNTQKNYNYNYNYNTRNNDIKKIWNNNNNKYKKDNITNIKDKKFNFNKNGITDNKQLNNNKRNSNSKYQGFGNKRGMHTLIFFKNTNYINYSLINEINKNKLISSVKYYSTKKNQENIKNKELNMQDKKNCEIKRIIKQELIINNKKEIEKIETPKGNKYKDKLRNYINIWNIKKQKSNVYKIRHKINYIKNVKNVFYNEKEAKLKNIKLLVKVKNKKENNNYNILSKKNSIKWDRLDYSIMRMIMKLIIIEKENENKNRSRRLREKKDKKLYNQFNKKDNSIDKDFISKFRNYSYGKLVGKIKNYVSNNDKLYIDIIKQDYDNINRDVLVTKTLNNFHYESNFLNYSYQYGYFNNNIYNSINIGINNSDGFFTRVWQTLNLNKREENFLNRLMFSDRVFKPYYRFYISLYIFNQYKYFIKKLGYRNLLIHFYLPIILSKFDWFKDNYMKIFNFISVKTMFNLFAFSYRSLYILKSKYYYINKLRYYHRKAKRLNFNTWLRSIRYLKALRKTPNNYWLRYHKLIKFFYIRIFKYAKWDAERKVLLPYVLYFEDLLYNIYGKWALIRIWPLKRYFLSSYIMTERLVLLLDKKSNYSKRRKSITGLFTRFVFKFINIVKVTKIEKVYEYNLDNNFKWPNELISVIKNDLPLTSVKQKLGEYYSKKLEMPYELSSYLLKNSNLYYYLPIINLYYFNLAKNVHFKIKKRKRFKFNLNIWIKKGYVKYWVRPMKNFILDINKTHDITGFEFRLAGKARSIPKAFSLIYQHGNFLGARHYNKITHKYITMTSYYIRNTLKATMDYTFRAGNFLPGTTTLKVWFSSLLSSDIMELLLYLKKKQEIYNALINRYFVVHSKVKIFIDYFKWISYRPGRLTYFDNIKYKMLRKFRKMNRFNLRKQIISGKFEIFKMKKYSRIYWSTLRKNMYLANKIILPFSKYIRVNEKRMIYNKINRTNFYSFLKVINYKSYKDFTLKKLKKGFSFSSILDEIYTIIGNKYKSFPVLNNKRLNKSNKKSSKLIHNNNNLFFNLRNRKLYMRPRINKNFNRRLYSSLMSTPIIITDIIPVELFYICLVIIYLLIISSIIFVPLIIMTSFKHVDKYLDFKNYVGERKRKMYFYLSGLFIFFAFCHVIRIFFSSYLLLALSFTVDTSLYTCIEFYYIRIIIAIFISIIFCILNYIQIYNYKKEKDKHSWWLIIILIFRGLLLLSALLFWFMLNYLDFKTWMELLEKSISAIDCLLLASIALESKISNVFGNSSGYIDKMIYQKFIKFNPILKNNIILYFNSIKSLNKPKINGNICHLNPNVSPDDNLLNAVSEGSRLHDVPYHTNLLWNIDGPRIFHFDWDTINKSIKHKQPVQYFRNPLYEAGILVNYHDNIYGGPLNKTYREEEVGSRDISLSTILGLGRNQRWSLTTEEWKKSFVSERNNWLKSSDALLKPPLNKSYDIYRLKELLAMDRHTVDSFTLITGNFVTKMMDRINRDTDKLVQANMAAYSHSINRTLKFPFFSGDKWEEKCLSFREIRPISSAINKWDYIVGYNDAAIGFVTNTNAFLRLAGSELSNGFYMANYKGIYKSYITDPSYLNADWLKNKIGDGSAEEFKNINASDLKAFVDYVVDANKTRIYYLNKVEKEMYKSIIMQQACAALMIDNYNKCRVPNSSFSVEDQRSMEKAFTDIKDVIKFRQACLMQTTTSLNINGKFPYIPDALWEEKLELKNDNPSLLQKIRHHSLHSNQRVMNPQRDSKVMTEIRRARPNINW
jgi:hypothetical protein